jgi:hypothetical protein
MGPDSGPRNLPSRDRPKPSPVGVGHRADIAFAAGQISQRGGFLMNAELGNESQMAGERLVEASLTPGSLFREYENTR